jgi:RecB family exonuclease
MAATWLGETIKVSNSEIQTWKDCRRRWYMTYYRELAIKRDQDKPVGARQLGTRIHVALDAMYGEQRNPLDVLNEIYAEDEKNFNEPDKITELRKEQDLAKAMLEGYVEWVAEEAADDGIELVAAETVIEVPVKDFGNVVIRGKLDQRVIRKVDNARLFLDHKTVANLTDPVRMLPLDEQMKFYHLLERLDSLYKTGGEPQWRTDGGLYNMLRKVKRTATAKPPFYGRAEIRHNDEVLRTTWIRVAKIIEELILARQALDSGADHQYIAPPRPSRDCTWKCDFFPVCPMMDDGSNVDGLFDEYYAHLDPHERYNAEDEGREVTK